MRKYVIFAPHPTPSHPSPLSHCAIILVYRFAKSQFLYRTATTSTSSHNITRWIYAKHDLWLPEIGAPGKECKGGRGARCEVRGRGLRSFRLGGDCSARGGGRSSVRVATSYANARICNKFVIRTPQIIILHNDQFIYVKMLLLPVAVGREVNYVARVARFVEFSPIFRQLVHNLRRETRHDWPYPSLSGCPSCPYLSFGVFGFLQCVTEIFQTGNAQRRNRPVDRHAANRRCYGKRVRKTFYEN